MNKDAFWFPHDSNAKDDDKCMLLIEELGLEGYGIYWVLIETLRDQKDYKAPLRIIAPLARKYNTTTEKMKAVVARYDLFEIEGENFFFSSSLKQRMEPLITKKHQRKIAGIKGNLIKYGYASKEQLNHMTDAQIIAMNDKKTASEGDSSQKLAKRSQQDRKPLPIRVDKSTVQYSREEKSTGEERTVQETATAPAPIKLIKGKYYQKTETGYLSEINPQEAVPELIPERDEFTEYGMLLRYSPEFVEMLYDKLESKGFCIRGEMIQDWKAYMRSHKKWNNDYNIGLKKQRKENEQLNNSEHLSTEEFIAEFERQQQLNEI
jgi:hypothetical protein